MRGIIFIILCCIVNTKCYIPQKAYDIIGTMTIYDTRQTELGWDIYWEDKRGNERKTFAKDTTIFHIGYSILTLTKQ